MNIKKLNKRLSQTVSVFIFLSIVNYGFATLPDKANYSVVTTHNCIHYECKKSLYKQNTLDIDQKNITKTQFKTTIEQRINKIQTTQTTYPGFNTTIKENIPDGLVDKALHCHKAKPLEINWNNSKQRTLTLKYRHECWQLKINNTLAIEHKEVERVEDVIYTVKITRTATSCSSAEFSVHPTNFECIPNQNTAQFRKYSLVPLDDLNKNSFITLSIGGDELEFVLVDTSDIRDVGSDGIARTQSDGGSDNNPADDPGVGAGGGSDDPGNNDPVDNGSDEPGNNDPVDNGNDGPEDEEHEPVDNGSDGPEDEEHEPVDDGNDGPEDEEHDLDDDINEPEDEEHDLDDDINEPEDEEHEGAESEHEESHEQPHDPDH